MYYAAISTHYIINGSKYYGWNEVPSDKFNWLNIDDYTIVNGFIFCYDTVFCDNKKRLEELIVLYELMGGEFSKTSNPVINTRVMIQLMIECAYLLGDL